MLGGVYLAAVYAARHGLRLLMLDPKMPASTPLHYPHAPAMPVFVDDLMNTGKAFRACDRFANNAGIRRYRYAALYSFGKRAALDQGEPIVGAVLATRPAGMGEGSA